VIIEDLEKEAWHWIIQDEDNSPYPVYVRDNGFISLDDYDHPIEGFVDFKFIKAIMPEST